MNQLKYRLKKRLYRLKARHKRGFGIHSPFVFHLLTNVIEFEANYYAFATLEKLRKICLHNIEEVFRSGKVCRSMGLSREKSIVRKGKKVDQLIFKLVNYFGPQYLYEIGASAGLSTAYMAKVNSKSKVFFVCEEQWREHVAKPLWNALFLTNIQTVILNESLGLSLPGPVDFVLFSSTLNSNYIYSYWQKLREGIHDKSLVVVKDIHRDSIRKTFWCKVIQEPVVKVSIDLFGVGLLLFREGMQKQDYVIKY